MLSRCGSRHVGKENEDRADAAPTARRCRAKIWVQRSRQASREAADMSIDALKHYRISGISMVGPFRRAPIRRQRLGVIYRDRFPRLPTRSMSASRRDFPWALMRRHYGQSWHARNLSLVWTRVRHRLSSRVITRTNWYVGRVGSFGGMQRRRRWRPSAAPIGRSVCSRELTYGDAN